MTKFCPECGFKQHNDNNRFCSNCGFDFSVLDDNQNNLDSDIFDDSTISVPISSDENHKDSSSSNSSSSANSSAVGSSGAGSSDSSAVGSSGAGSVKSGAVGSSGAGSVKSTTKKPSNSKYKTQTANDFNNIISKLSFNKCLIAFAILLVILVFIGMFAQSTQTEPYSDDGLTSFMESSDESGVQSLFDNLDSNDDNYDNDSNDFLSSNDIDLK